MKTELTTEKDLLEKVKEIYKYSSQAAVSKFDIRDRLFQLIEDYEYK